MNVDPYFTILVYPFRHTLSPDELKAHLHRLNLRWQPWWRRLDRDALKHVLDDSYFFLPPIRAMLFPETVQLPLGDAAQQVTSADQLARRSTAELAETLHPDGVLRLTYESELLEVFAHLQLEFQRRDAQGKIVQDFCAPFHLSWIDVALFPQQVGFLMLKVELDEAGPTVDRINDFLYYVRLVHPPSLDWQMAYWKQTAVEAPLSFRGRDLVDFLLQGLAEGPNDLDPTLHTFVSRLRQGDIPERYSAMEAGQVYGQVFHLFSYTCLAAPSTSMAPEVPPETADHAPPPAAESSPPLFASPIQRVLYELATCTKTADPDYRPHAVGLKQLMDKGHIALWANWEGMALHDNVLFLGTVPTSFTRHSFQRNVENDYFNLYLLTLYQKMRLSFMSGELMRRDRDLHRNLSEARALSDAFVMFRNHYWFAEVTLKPQGAEIYRRFQRGLDALSLYESVSDEVHELQEYYERQVARNIEESTHQLQQDMAENVAATRRLQATMNDNISIVATVQKRIEVLEVLIFSVYGAHLFEMVFSHISAVHGHEWKMVILGAVLGAVTGYAILRPGHHGQREAAANPSSSTKPDDTEMATTSPHKR